jgi:hypothetical protein
MGRAEKTPQWGKEAIMAEIKIFPATVEVAPGGTRQFAAAGATAPDWSLAGQTDTTTDIDPVTGLLTVGADEEGPLTVIANECLGTTVSSGTATVTVKAAATPPRIPTNADEVKKLAANAVKGKAAWIAVIVGMIVAGFAGMLFGQNWSAGMLGDVAASEAAFKTLQEGAYDVLNTPSIYDAWNGGIFAIIVFVGIVIALNALSKGSTTPRQCLAYIATILAAVAGTFCVKNVLVALYNGLPLGLIPLPPLIVGILLVLVAVWAVKKFFKKK